ncbi:MAG: hypothetical protein AB1391_02000 [Candidatus Micrarchaeota archaeon]
MVENQLLTIPRKIKQKLENMPLIPQQLKLENLQEKLKVDLVTLKLFRDEILRIPRPSSLNYKTKLYEIIIPSRFLAPKGYLLDPFSIFYIVSKDKTCDEVNGKIVKRFINYFDIFHDAHERGVELLNGVTIYPNKKDENLMAHLRAIESYKDLRFTEYFFAKCDPCSEDMSKTPKTDIMEHVKIFELLIDEYKDYCFYKSSVVKWWSNLFTTIKEMKSEYMNNIDKMEGFSLVYKIVFLGLLNSKIDEIFKENVEKIDNYFKKIWNIVYDIHKKLEELDNAYLGILKSPRN